LTATTITLPACVAVGNASAFVVVPEFRVALCTCAHDGAVWPCTTDADNNKTVGMAIAQATTNRSRPDRLCGRSCAEHVSTD